VLDAEPDEADGDGDEEEEEDDEPYTGDDLPQAALAHELEIAIIPLVPRLDVRVGVGMVTPTAKPIRVPTESGTQVRLQLCTKSSAARALHRQRFGHGSGLSFPELNLSFL
jgi:hypothetical protein